MASSLFQNQQQVPQNQGQNPIQMIAQFKQFKKMMTGKNPQAMVNALLQSGQMSNAQFNALSQQAKALVNILK